VVRVQFERRGGVDQAGIELADLTAQGLGERLGLRECAVLESEEAMLEFAELAARRETLLATLGPDPLRSILRIPRAAVGQDEDADRRAALRVQR